MTCGESKWSKGCVVQRRASRWRRWPIKGGGWWSPLIRWGICGLLPRALGFLMRDLNTRWSNKSRNFVWRNDYSLFNNGKRMPHTWPYQIPKFWISSWYSTRSLTSTSLDCCSRSVQTIKPLANPRRILPYRILLRSGTVGILWCYESIFWVLLQWNSASSDFWDLHPLSDA